MELLIELIVWIFKALAGEDQKTKPRRQGGQDSPPLQRGPYNYGDGQAGKAGRPRTLEEILEEVKRLQKQEQGQPAPWVQPRQGQTHGPVQAAAQPKPGATVPQAVPGLDQMQERHIQSNLDTRILKTNMEDKEIVRPQTIQKKFDKLKAREETRFRPLSEASPTGQDAVTLSNDISGVAIQTQAKPQSYADFFKTMRAAPAQSRAEIARRAFVFSEVFGLPRSRRALREKR